MKLLKVKIDCLTANVVCARARACQVMIIEMSCMCSCFELRSVLVCTCIYLGCSVVSVNCNLYLDFVLCVIILVSYVRGD
jgi:hypothetical protein